MVSRSLAAIFHLSDFPTNASLPEPVTGRFLRNDSLVPPVHARHGHRNATCWPWANLLGGQTEQLSLPLPACFRDAIRRQIGTKSRRGGHGYEKNLHFLPDTASLAVVAGLECSRIGRADSRRRSPMPDPASAQPHRFPFRDATQQIRDTVTEFRSRFRSRPSRIPSPSPCLSYAKHHPPLPRPPPPSASSPCSGYPPTSTTSLSRVWPASSSPTAACPPTSPAEAISVELGEVQCLFLSAVGLRQTFWRFPHER